MDDSSTAQPEGTLDEKQEVPRNDPPGKLLYSDNADTARSKKEEAIRKACNLRDLDALVSYATSEGGLLNDDLRRSACKLLVNG
jgi:hypothetical protein